MATYQLQINLDDETLTYLANNTNVWLRVFKGETTNVFGVNMLWYSLNTFTNPVNIQWTDDYWGFICPDTPLAKGNTISAKAVSMQTGQLLSMDDAGVTQLTSNGIAGALTFFSKSKVRVCGAGQTVAGANQFYTAMQILGYDTNVIIPQEKLLLVFEYGGIDNGTIVFGTLGRSLLISMTAVAPTATVSYSISKSWDFGSNPNASIIAPPIVNITTILRTQYKTLLRM